MTLSIAADAPLPGIEHIVVVMLENRSFDNVLGRLYAPTDRFWGVKPGIKNSFKHDTAGYDVFTSNQVASGSSPFITPRKVPGEAFSEMRHQIFGYGGGDAPDMSGFAQNYHDVHLTMDVRDVGDIMHYFEPTQMSVSNHLAAHFAVCDQWFASGPVQTFPNRMFCHCGTPGRNGKGEALLNDTDYGWRAKTYDGAVSDTSIFELLDRGGPKWNPARWKVYFHDTMFSIINEYVNEAWKVKSPCLSSYDRTSYTHAYGTTFLQDLRNDALPAYAFIEPRYFDNYDKSGNRPNCNHPGGGNHIIPSTGTSIDVRDGEALLTEIYLALINYPEIFAKTLLIITYDEHGGTFDHIAPNTAPFAAKAVSPFKKDDMPSNFDYSRYGVRVPAIFCNPKIPAGTIYRPAQPASGEYYPFDHTSIIATLRAQFGLGDALTPRDAVAPTFKGLIQQNAPVRKDLDLGRMMPVQVGMVQGNPYGGPRLTDAEMQSRMEAILRGKAGKG